MRKTRWMLGLLAVVILAGCMQELPDKTAAPMATGSALAAAESAAAMSRSPAPTVAATPRPVPKTTRTPEPTPSPTPVRKEYQIFATGYLDYEELPDGTLRIVGSFFKGLMTPLAYWSEKELAEEDLLKIPDMIEDKRVTEIDETAFRSVYETEVVLPEWLEKLGTEAFEGNIRLKRINIPAGLREMGQNPFSGCGRLEVINIHSDNEWFTWEDKVLMTADGKRLIYCDLREKEQYAVPEGVEKIDEYAFRLRRERGKKYRITLPASVDMTEEGEYGLWSVEYAEENDDLTLVVEKGSAAEAYAEKEGYKYEYIEERG